MNEPGMKFSLSAVMVTGAASGLGRAVCFALARHAVPVWCLDADRAGAEQVVAKIRAFSGVAEALAADVADEQAVGNAFAEVARRGHAIDGLVTCAGILNTTGILDLTLAEWERVMSVNLRGTFLC